VGGSAAPCFCQNKVIEMTTIISKSGTGVPSPDKLETAELAVDVSSGDLYTKLSDNSVVQINGGSTNGGTGSSVHIGENPPSDPQEGQQWMEVPASGDATMWIYDDGNGGQWLQQPGGKDGAPGADGNIADGTQDGIVATWDDTAKQWTPDSSMVIDASGNVGIGTIEPKTKLEIVDNTNDSPVLRLTDSRTVPQAGNFLGGIEFYQRRTGAVDSYIYSYFDNLTNTSLSFGTAGTERMRIDASGNVGIGGGPAEKLHVAGGNMLIKSAYDASGITSSFIYLANRGAGNWRNTYIGAESSSLIFGTGGSGEPHTNATERMRIAADGRVDITGSLYVNGTPKIGADDLIKTLQTLRNATKDETTLEGLRDSIGNAIGGLIEEFENQISTMPAGEES